MKKIIAMILCVAMIAALGASAFAEPLTAPHSWAYYWNKQAASQNASKGAIRNYAEGLAGAKKAYGDAKDAYDKAIGALANAETRVIYEALEDWYGAALAVANTQFANALTETQVAFQIALNQAIDPDWKPWFIEGTAGQNITGYEAWHGDFTDADVQNFAGYTWNEAANLF